MRICGKNFRKRVLHLSDFEHHAHQMRERRRLHLFHHARAVNFHRALTQLQIAGDHFVRLAVHHEIEHFALARRQSFETAPYVVALAERSAIAAVFLQRLVDAIDEVLVAERLLDEIDRARLHGLHCHRHVAVTGDEDDRQDRMLFVELLLQLQSRHAGHADVEHQAARAILAVRVEKLLRRAERLHRVSDRAQQQFQRIADCSIVVHHEDGRPGNVGRSPHYQLPADAGTAGNVKKKRAPPPGLAPHHSLPPWARTMERLIDRPRPVPPGLVVKNGLNSSAIVVASTPTPRSATMNSTSPSLSTSVRRTISRRASGTSTIASMLLRTRLRTTCWICTASACTSGACGAGSSSMRTPLCRASVCASVSTSSSKRFASTSSRRTSRFLTKVRRRRITSPARSACAPI